MASTASYQWKERAKGNLHDPTPYAAAYCRASSTSNSASATSNSAYAASATPSANAIAAARNRLSAQVRGSQRASVALTALSWRQSLDMVSSRAGQLTRAAVQLRKGNVPGFLRILSDQKSDIRKVPRASWRGSAVESNFRRKWSSKRAQKEPAQAWLEANFGWAPLYEDIHAATEVLGSQPAVEFCTASAKDPPKVLSNVYSYVKYDRPTGGPWGLLFDLKQDQYIEYVSLRTGCIVKGINPNAALLSGLGLTNPAYVAWDAVPFSFVVDWFIPVGSFLKSFDAFVGFDLSKEWTTVRRRANRDYHYAYAYYGGGSLNNQNTSTSVYVRRSTSIPPVPSIASLQSNFRPSLWTAVTSLSLLQTTLGTLLGPRK